MSIDTNTVKRIGYLAKIKLSESDIEMFSKQLGQIVEFMKQLDEVNTSDIQDIDTGNSEGHTNRPKDLVMDGNYIDKILKNAPDTKEGFFTVTKVIE